jgi:hypothetical protein
MVLGACGLCSRWAPQLEPAIHLFGIARNLYRDLIEHQRRLVPITEMAEPSDPAPLPDRAVANQQTFSAILKAIQRLPELQREALVLSMDEDLSYDQIDQACRPNTGNWRRGDSHPARFAALSAAPPCLRFERNLTASPARLEAKMESLPPFLWGSCIP